jgi:hypothetical protein
MATHTINTERYNATADTFLAKVASDGIKFDVSGLSSNPVEFTNALLDAGVSQGMSGDYHITHHGMATMTAALEDERRPQSHATSSVLLSHGTGQHGTIDGASEVMQFSRGSDMAGFTTTVEKQLALMYAKDAGVRNFAHIIQSYSDVNSTSGLVHIYHRLFRGLWHTTNYNQAPRQAEIAGREFHHSARLLPWDRTAAACFAAGQNHAMEDVMAGLQVSHNKYLTRILMTVDAIPDMEMERVRRALAVLAQMTKENLGFAPIPGTGHSCYTKGVKKINDILIIPLSRSFQKIFESDGAGMDDDGVQVQYQGMFMGQACNQKVAAFPDNFVQNPRSWLDAISIMLSIMGGGDQLSRAMTDSIRTTALFPDATITMLSSPVKNRLDPVFAGLEMVAYRRLVWMYTRLIRGRNHANEGFLDRQATQWPVHPMLGQFAENVIQAVNLSQHLVQPTLDRAFGVGVAQAGNADNCQFPWASGNNTEQVAPGRCMVENYTAANASLSQLGTWNPARDVNQPDRRDHDDLVTGLEKDNYWFRYFLNFDLHDFESFKKVTCTMGMHEVSELLIWACDLDIPAGPPVWAERWNYQLMPATSLEALGRNAAQMRSLCWVRAEKMLTSSNLYEKTTERVFAGATRSRDAMLATNTMVGVDEDLRLANAFYVTNPGRLWSVYMAIAGIQASAADVVACQTALTKYRLALTTSVALTDNARLDAALQNTTMALQGVNAVALRDNLIAGFAHNCRTMGLSDMQYNISRLVENNLYVCGQEGSLRTCREDQFVTYRRMDPSMLSFFLPGVQLNGGKVRGDNSWWTYSVGDRDTFGSVWKLEDEAADRLSLQAAMQRAACMSNRQLDFSIRFTVSSAEEEKGLAQYDLFRHYTHTMMRTNDLAPVSSLHALSPLEVFSPGMAFVISEDAGSTHLPLYDIQEKANILEDAGYAAFSWGYSNQRRNVTPSVMVGRDTQGNLNKYGLNGEMDDRFASMRGIGRLNDTTNRADGPIIRGNNDDGYRLRAIRVQKVENVNSDFFSAAGRGNAVAPGKNWNVPIFNPRGLFIPNARQPGTYSLECFRLNAKRMNCRMYALTGRFHYRHHVLVKSQASDVALPEMINFIEAGLGSKAQPPAERGLALFGGAAATSRWASVKPFLDTDFAKRGATSFEVKDPVTVKEKNVPSSEGLEVGSTSDTAVSSTPSEN